MIECMLYFLLVFSVEPGYLFSLCLFEIDLVLLAIRFQLAHVSGYTFSVSHS